MLHAHGMVIHKKRLQTNVDKWFKAVSSLSTEQLWPQNILMEPSDIYSKNISAFLKAKTSKYGSNARPLYLSWWNNILPCYFVTKYHETFAQEGSGKEHQLLYSHSDFWSLLSKCETRYVHWIIMHCKIIMPNSSTNNEKKNMRKNIIPIPYMPDNTMETLFCSSIFVTQIN
jgi:predicted glycosyltransferase involved in capsule biosynthesis